MPTRHPGPGNIGPVSSETNIFVDIRRKHWSRVGEEARRELEASGLDAAIAKFAEVQHDVLAWWQLEALGIGRGSIADRLRRKRLHSVHQGVYSPSPRIRPGAGALAAAVLAAGPDAVLARRSAGAHLAIRPNASPRIEVIVPRSLQRRARIVPIHSRLPADEVRIVDGIPVTTPPRTVLDLAGVLPAHDVEQAMERVEALRLWDPLSLGDLLARYPGRRGTRTLRAILAAEQLGRGVTREELEAAFRAFLSELTLPRPEINVPLTVGDDSFVPDFLWWEQRVIVELDGFDTHGTRRAFERDRRRDRRLQVAGWRTIRVTWRHLHEEREELAADLELMLLTSERRATP